MRRVLFLFLVAIILPTVVPGTARATLPGPDALGLYFDEEAQYRDLTVSAGESFQLFLILTHPTMNAIEGWEAAVILTNGNTVTTTEFPVGSQPLLNGPEDWAVTMATPMPCNVLTKLAVFTVLAATDQHAPIYLGNISSPSLPGEYPSVRPTGAEWTALQLSSGDPGDAVATVNGSTPTALSSWGALKSLFR